MQANNTRNGQGSSTLPTITLTVLVAMIAALLYVGYEYVADNTGGAEELTNVALDTTTQSLAGQGDPEFITPLDTLTDTTATPTPVDLSQAPAPVEEPANAAAVEDVAADNREKTEGKPSAEELKKAESATETPKAEPEAAKPVEKIAVKPGGSASTHTVQSGETFYGIANRYNMKISTLKELNPDVSEEQVKSGVTKLKVKVMAVHTVGPGDVLRVVAQKYGVSKEALMRANGKSKDMATRGERLVIPYPEKQ
ncbi:LysM peptidoglycan-binding domain-containing protein [Rudanella lutea]|uniref:LysM peptidoglycan-binding domain-containing protein n=1 Tax=Rudanella lutea TaxID=451374 RepID=UPI00037BA315|nr:LysM peptidoglycan-binding domain-containing protein [Rudanella lutea]